jgi:hypothetical protein
MARATSGTSLGLMYPLAIGDMATTKVQDPFRLVYLLDKTLMNLTIQNSHVDCFVSASSHLQEGEAFVVEVMVPALRRLPPRETIVPFTVTPTHVGFDEYDLATQTSLSHLGGIWMDGFSSRRRSGTYGRQSSTSGRASPGCPWSNAGATESAIRSRARARPMYRYGRRRPEISGNRGKLSAGSTAFLRSSRNPLLSGAADRCTT